MPWPFGAEHRDTVPTISRSTRSLITSATTPTTRGHLSHPNAESRTTGVKHPPTGSRGKPRKIRANAPILRRASRPLDGSKSLDVAALLFVVLLHVDAYEDSATVWLVVDAAHVFAAGDTGRELRDFAPATHSCEIFAHALAHIDLHEAPQDRCRCIEIG